MNVQTKQTKLNRQPATNGHNGNGATHPNPDELRFTGIVEELEHLPSVTPELLAQQPAWLRNPLQKARGLILMAVQKKPGGITVRDWIAGALLATSLTFTANLYWKRQDEHDELIRLRTLMEVSEKNNTERDLRIETARNFATVADKNVTRLEGKIDQFMQIYSIKNASKANLTYTPE